MSLIFQETAPKVHVHKLPKGAEFFSYRLDDFLKINAWMPDDYQEIHQHFEMTSDCFYETYCSECVRNCYSFLNQHADDDGEIVWSDIEGGEMNHCWVYDEGYTGQSCPEGNEHEDFTVDMRIANMVFQVSLTYKYNKNRSYDATFVTHSDKAFLRAGVVNDDLTISATRTKMASNVFGDEYEVGSICWGANDAPNNLRGVVEEYFNSPYNNDLLPVNQFEINSSYIRREKNRGNFQEITGENFLSYGENVDSLILVHAEQNIPAFFTLLSAGFNPIESAPYLMLIPAKGTQIEVNGNTYYGYETIPDALNKKWFISSDEQVLVGQI